MTKWTIRGTVLCLAWTTLMLSMGAGASADDEEPELLSVRRSLVAYTTPPPIAGPNLGTPADLIAQQGDIMWNGDPGDERLGWLAFQQPALDRTALSPETLCELFQELYVETLESVEGTEVSAIEHTLQVRLPASMREQASADLDWLIRSMTPSVTVDARLERTAPENRLRAVGRATLWPGRWMPVFFQKDEMPSVVDYDIEIAQESTAADPLIQNLVEGCELYLRYHPGETRSLVEVWIADVEHLDVQRIDLSELRNVPEGNGLGVLNAPNTAIDRAFGCIVIPNGETVEREIIWTRKGRVQRLALRLAAPSAGAPRSRGEQAVAMLRSGAVVSGLEFNARPVNEGQWMDELRRTGGDEEAAIDPIAGDSISRLSGPAGVLSKMKSHWANKERALIEHTVTMDLWRVPEPAYRAALDAGSVQIGRPVSSEVLQTFRQAGGASCESVHLPALDGVRTGFRVGESVPGLIDFDVEVAQQAAAMDPRMWALFRGVFSDITVTAGAERTVLHAAGEIVWADASAGIAELVFRPPVSMKPSGDGQKPEPDHRRRAKMPLLSGGSTTFDARVPIAPGRETLLHVSVRGDEVTLVLVGSVRREEK